LNHLGAKLSSILALECHFWGQNKASKGSSASQEDLLPENKTGIDILSQFRNTYLITKNSISLYLSSLKLQSICLTSHFLRYKFPFCQNGGLKWQKFQPLA
jgi:hypothetical protein